MPVRPAETHIDPRQEVWREPVRGGYADPALFALSGLEQMRALLDGRAPEPPINHLFGLKPTRADVGQATFTMPASPWLVSPPGVLTVGTLAILADAPLGCAVWTLLPPGTAYTTSELSLRVLRPARVGTVLTARSQALHVGRKIALSEVRMEDAAGRLTAHGSSLCHVLPPGALSATLPAAAARPPAYATPDPYLRPANGEIIPQEVWDQKSGLEVLRALRSGELPLPPLAYLTGLRLVEVEPGQASLALPASEWLCSPSGWLEGGVIAMLADAALAAAILTVTPARTAVATIDLKVEFTRPAMADGRELVARGMVAHRGRTTVVANATVGGSDGKPVAVAIGSALLLPGRSASLVGRRSDQRATRTAPE